MNSKTNKLLIAAISSMILFSCTNKGNNPTVYHEGTRDNIINVTDKIIPIDDKLPILHPCELILTGDTLLFSDPQSADLSFTAFDLNRDTVIGRFGKHGSGPGELANYGGIFYDANTRQLYVTEASKGKIYGFYLPEAIANQDYTPFVKLNMNFNGGSNGYSSPHYINDSTIICSVLVRNDKSRSFSSHIGNLNLISGTVSVIDTIPDSDNIRYSIVVLPDRDMVVAAGKVKDEIRIYNLNGALKSTIYGPDYDETVVNSKRYFSRLITCGDKIAAIYAGGSEQNGHDIVVMDLTGKYLKTIRFEQPLHNIKYHPKSDRLYVVTDDTPQFGYIENFSELLDGKIKKDSDKAKTVAVETSEIEEVDPVETHEVIADDETEASTVTDGDKAEVSEEDDSNVKCRLSDPKAAEMARRGVKQSSEGPLTFVDPNIFGAPPVEHLKVGAYPDGEKYRYTISIFNRSDEPVAIESICLPDSYFKTEWTTTNTLAPNSMGFLRLFCDKPLSDKPYPIIINFRDGKYPPQTLSMTLYPSGAQLYNEMQNKK